MVPVLISTVARKVEKKPKTSRVAAEDKLDEERKARPRKSVMVIKRKAPRGPLKSVLRTVELPREDRLLISPLDLLPDEAKKVKKKKRKALFVLPQPCKGEICKPKVCCWRPGVKAERKRRLRGERRLTSDSAVSVRSADKWRRRGMKSRAFREMQEPPTVLKEELLEAKAEIEMAKRPRVRSAKAR